MRTRLRRACHLVAGFGRDLWPARVRIEDEELVYRILTDAERRAWEVLAPCDRREAVRALRSLTRSVGPNIDDEVAAALLLHDVGKSRSGLGPFGRAVATVVGAPVSPETMRRWETSDGWRRRVALYCDHARVGERILDELGARRLVSAWAGAHHSPQRWEAVGLPAGVAEALARADGECFDGH